MSTTKEASNAQLKRSLAERRMISNRLMKDFPDRVPVVVWPIREPDEQEEGVGDGRFLVARALTVGHFAQLLREVLELGAHDDVPLFLWCGNKLLSPLISFRFLQQNFQEEDGFVYLYMSDLGGSPIELKTLGMPGEEPRSSTASARRTVDFNPPELAHSLPRLRYPSPPEPDEPTRTTFGSSTFRVPSDVSQHSVSSNISSAVGAGILAVLPAPVLPALHVSALSAGPLVRRRALRGHPRPVPPPGVTPQVPSPPPSHMESFGSIFEDTAAARGAGPDASDDEESPSGRVDELQAALGVRGARTSFFTADSLGSYPKEATRGIEGETSKAIPSFDVSSNALQPEEDKPPTRVPAWLRDPKAPIQF